METAMSQPHAKSRGNERVAVTHGERNQCALASTQRARQPRRGAEQDRGLDNEKDSENNAENRSFVVDGKQFSQPGLNHVCGTDHAEGIEKCSETEDNREGGDILAAGKVADARTDLGDQDRKSTRLHSSHL